jgi:dTDP-glucose 4,6-dehydratase
MKLLVTGGSGFIGSNFILYWIKHHQHDEIVNLDLLTYAGNPDNLKDIENEPRYRFMHGDICDPDAVTAAMEGVDAVVHFAAESHVDRSIMDPSRFVRTNVLGTQVLLDAALKRDAVRFHHVSTDEVYGTLALDGEDAFDETTPYDPRSPYAASKAGSDHLVRAYHHTYGLPVTVSNCSNNFGPYQFPEKLIPLAITNIIEGKRIPVYGDGRHVRDWLYVDDHCRAIELILEKGKIGDTYTVGGMTDHISNREVVETIAEAMGKDASVMEFVKDRPGHDVRYSVDWTKIRDELSWKPEHEFRTYLEKTITWYSTHTDWWKRVKSGEYRSYYEKQYGTQV